MVSINKNAPTRFGRLGLAPEDYEQNWASDLIRTLDQNFRNIQENVNNIATTDALGVVQVGSGLDITKFGVLSVSPSYGALGYYGSFYDTTTQTIASTTTAYAIGINTTIEANGVSIVSGNRITVANAGTYNIQFSVQAANTDTQIHDLTIWMKKNGTDVTGSAGIISVPNSHGGVEGRIISSWNYVMTLAANDYIQMYWHADNTLIKLETVAAGSSPTTPSSPSIIVTVQEITHFQVSTLGFSTLPGNYANDAAAAAGGVAIGGVYRNGSVLQVRVT